MLFFTTVLIKLFVVIHVTQQISLTFKTYPPSPKFGEFVSFSAVIQSENGSSDLDQLLKDRLKNASFLWYSKSNFDDEFGLLGFGKVLIVKVDSYFNAIYNLTLIIDNGLKVLDYTRPVSFRPQFGIEISINNQSFRSDFHRMYPIVKDKFGFRCRIIGEPRFFNLIFPSGATCENQIVEEIPQIRATDFIFESCNVIPSESYGCRIANSSKKYVKTFKIVRSANIKAVVV